MLPQQIAAFEELVGDFLHELDYRRTSEFERRRSLRAVRLRATYLAMFEAKHWIRTKTPLGRFVGLGPLEMEPKTPARG
jgi:hypothetical protein